MPSRPPARRYGTLAEVVLRILIMLITPMYAVFFGRVRNAALSAKLRMSLGEIVKIANLTPL